jgi:hypothetical protein
MSDDSNIRPSLRGRDELPLIRFCFARRYRQASSAPDQLGPATRSSPLPFLPPQADPLIYNHFGLLRSYYTLLVIATVEAIINELGMKRSLFRLLYSLANEN